MSIKDVFRCRTKFYPLITRYAGQGCNRGGVSWVVETFRFWIFEKLGFF